MNEILALVNSAGGEAPAELPPEGEALAQFALRTRQERDVGSAVRNIAALAAAGYRVSPEQVAAETGYEVTAAPANAPQPAFAADALLAEIAAAVLDGSVPYEEAIRRADRALAAIDPAQLAGGLEKALEGAMFRAAARIPRSRSVSLYPGALCMVYFLVLTASAFRVYGFLEATIVHDFRVPWAFHFRRRGPPPWGWPGTFFPSFFPVIVLSAFADPLDFTIFLYYAHCP